MYMSLCKNYLQRSIRSPLACKKKDNVYCAVTGDNKQKAHMFFREVQMQLLDKFVPPSNVEAKIFYHQSALASSQSRKVLIAEVTITEFATQRKRQQTKVVGNSCSCNHLTKPGQFQLGELCTTLCFI